ncbi:MAG: Rieske 2Fe-2S domain-containing protein [Chloroflexota bacterium]|nr:Rieske 2Fe-2S domain-containing protein [Chloroflexota bacterium]
MVKELSREAEEAQLGESVEAYERQKPWERYIDAEMGLRNYWYPALFSHELKEGEIQTATICGERLLFKRIDGVVYCVEDRCVHRGVAFSAQPECYTKNTITCWLHGFTYDWRDGNLVQVISEPGGAIIGKASIKSYHMREMNRTIFVYIGDGEPVSPDEDLPPEFMKAVRGERRIAFHPLVRVLIPCNWRPAVENGFDPGHVYGHRGSDIVQRGYFPVPLGFYAATKDQIKLEEREGRTKGIILQHTQFTLVWEAEIEGQRLQAKAATEAAPPPQNYSADIVGGEYGGGAWYMPCTMEGIGFPQPSMIHYEWYVPVDADHHMYTILQAAYVDTDEDEERFHVECEEKWGPLVWSTPGSGVEGFNNFDAFGRAEIHHAYRREGWWRRERMYKPDYALTQWRMLVSKHARDIQPREGDWTPRPAPEHYEVKFVDTPGQVR